MCDRCERLHSFTHEIVIPSPQRYTRLLLNSTIMQRVTHDHMDAFGHVGGVMSFSRVGGG